MTIGTTAKGYCPDTTPQSRLSQQSNGNQKTKNRKEITLETPSQFEVKGIPQTVFNRVVNTATFKSASAVFLGVVLDSLTNATGLGLGWKAVMYTGLTSAGIVVLKDLIRVLTLPRDAADPSKPEVTKKGE
jgi:hypothetical protein